MSTTKLAAMLGTLGEQRARLDIYREAWLGDRPTAYLSAKSRDSLDKRLNRLSVNFPRLVVQTLTDRLKISGIRRGRDIDEDIWQAWRAARLIEGSALVHVDRALYGAAYVTLWAHASQPGRAVAMLDNPRTMYAETDPATGEVRRAVRYWRAAGAAHALLIEPDRQQRYRAQNTDGPADSAGTWAAVGEPVPNPWGTVPVVPFIRRESAEDTDTGRSIIADVLDLSAALDKVLQDAMVTSEYYARPRRTATGLEIVEDDDGNPVDPFGESRLMQSEDPETRFGQLAAGDLNAYSDLSAMFTQHIGALTGLPPHYLGLHGDQPANADGVKAAETQLVSMSYAEQAQLEPGWGDVAAWLHAITQSADVPNGSEYRPVFDSPETRTAAQAADAAQKLHSMGVPLRELLEQPLGYGSERIEAIMEQRDREQIMRAAQDIAGLLP